MTPKTLPPWLTSPGSVLSTPEQPVLLCSAWPCVSWPSTNVTTTLLQLTVPSSGSVTVTVYGMLSPKLNVPPSTGVLTTTVGEVLPAVIFRLADALRFDESVTVSTAVYTCCGLGATCVYVCEGFGSIDVVPSPKSQ